MLSEPDIKNVFDDEFYSLLEGKEIDMFERLKPSIGDLIIYNYKTGCFDTLPKQRCGKEDDKSIIGIVINVNEDNTIDAIMKNYLTSERLIVPISYYNKPKHIPAYITQLFDRFISKYKHDAVLDISDIKYRIPSIGLLDFMLHDIQEIINTMEAIWGKEKSDLFIERMMTSGVVSVHKRKMYRWLPNTEKREIQNIAALLSYELLPIFSLKYS